VFFFASLSIFSILDDDGKLIGFAGNTKDVTNTINIQEALFEKQRQLVSIIDNTEDVIVSIDRNFRIVEFNLVLASFVKRGYNYGLKKGDYMLDYIDPNIIT
jgi:PAS domain-containing protein